VSKKIRNIAIIAHVDHGKTTLVDKLLQQSGTLDKRAEPVERMMDSNELEKERGITILAKNTSISWQDYQINIVDTPGHADFGGEVERILSMVDSVLLLVDAVDGPMPQTRFVTMKAFAAGLSPIVVVNKVDRPGARPHWVIDKVFDLFDSLGATDAQLDFPVVYASALQGFAMLELEETSDSMQPLFETIVNKVAPPKVELNGPFQMQISSLDYSSYLGVIGVGRVTRGTIATNQPIVVLDSKQQSRNAKMGKIFGYHGLERVEIESAQAGDIVAVTGIEALTISETVCDKDNPEPLPLLSVDEPTISMIFQTNDSPFMGKEGKFVTSRQLRDRLYQETIHNIALNVEDTDNADKFLVSGRGELHLGILIETMRREGYELAVSKPIPIVREVDGVQEEPYENLVLDINSEHQGTLMEVLGQRKAKLNDMQIEDSGRVRIEYTVTARGLIGLQNDFVSITSGTGIMSHNFSHYGPLEPDLKVARHQGVLIANTAGVASAYALWNLQARGKMMIGPQTDVYEGMIVGLSTRPSDIVVNVTKEKQLTNIRAAGSDENIILTPPMKLTLESALGFINDDELVEVTPKGFRLRKLYLKEHERKRHKK